MSGTYFLSQPLPYEAHEENYQLSVSGVMVFNLYFDFAQVRHEAFSNLAAF